MIPKWYLPFVYYFLSWSFTWKIIDFSATYVTTTDAGMIISPVQETYVWPR